MWKSRTLPLVRTPRKVVVSEISEAAGAALNQAASIIGNQVPESRAVFRCGAFDLARRLNRDLRNVPRMPQLLSSILTRTGIAALRLA